MSVATIWRLINRRAKKWAGELCLGAYKDFRSNTLFWCRIYGLREQNYGISGQIGTAPICVPYGNGWITTIAFEINSKGGQWLSRSIHMQRPRGISSHCSFSSSFHQHWPLHRFKGIIYTIPTMSSNRRFNVNDNLIARAVCGEGGKPTTTCE